MIQKKVLFLLAFCVSVLQGMENNYKVTKKYVGGLLAGYCGYRIKFRGKNNEKLARATYWQMPSEEKHQAILGDIFVAKEYRSKGIGSAMLYCVKKEIIKDFSEVTEMYLTIAPFDWKGKFKNYEDAFRALVEWYRKNEFEIQEDGISAVFNLTK